MVLACAVAGLGFAAGLAIAPRVAQTSQPATGASPRLLSSTRTTQDTALLVEAWRIIDQQYAGGSVDAQILLRGALRGMVDALGDPYSSYSTAKEVAQSAAAGDADLQTVGMALIRASGSLLVVAPLAGSPAQAAGVQAGDRISAIDGVGASSLTLGDVLERLRSPAGTPVTLTLLRDGQSYVTTSFVRGTVSTPLLRASILPSSVAYVNITAFAGPTARELVAFLQTLEAQDVRGLVLDLRNNPGGYIDSAVEVAGQFIADGVIVTQQERAGAVVWSYSDGGKTVVIDGPDGKKMSPVRTPPLAADLPLVVLVNRGTASAAEVLAAALQDHGRAILMGEQTFGKAAVGGDYALSDGSVLHLTDGQWLSPKGRSVAGQGLSPDLSVAAAGGNDDVLAQAVLYLTTKH